jgi:hypothetical protein
MVEIDEVESEKSLAARSFFVEGRVVESIDEWEAWSKGLAPFLANTSGAFCSTMRAACSAAAIPEHVAYTHIWRRGHLERFRQEYRDRVPNPFAEREEMLRAGKVYDDDERHEVAERAATEWLELATTKESLSDEASESLEADLEADDGLQKGQRNLMRMTAVLIWGGIEALATDAFESTLNDSPGLARALLGHKAAKTLWPLPKLSLEMLEDHGFDLRNRLGTLLSGIHRVDTVPVMQLLAEAWLPESRLEQPLATLKLPALRMLAQRRHVIVHRGARVDEEYVRNTGDRGTLIGDQIEISTTELVDYFKLGLDVGRVLLEICWIAARGPADGSV